MASLPSHWRKNIVELWTNRLEEIPEMTDNWKVVGYRMSPLQDIPQSDDAEDDANDGDGRGGGMFRHKCL